MDTRTITSIAWQLKLEIEATYMDELREWASAIKLLCVAPSISDLPASQDQRTVWRFFGMAVKNRPSDDSISPVVTQ
jgi:hypothetical protein